MSKARDIDIQILIEHPIERIFDAWLQPDLLERWLTRKANVEPAIGGAYELYWEPENPDRNSTKGCRITGLVRNSELSFSWRGPAEYADLMGDKTQVYVRLTRCEGGTLLRFVHTGWGCGPRWDSARAWQTEAWREALENLKNMMENTGRFMQDLSFN